MNNVSKFSALFIMTLISFSTRAAAQEAPNVLIRRISMQVIDAAKADMDIQADNRQKVWELVEDKIFPYVNFTRMTALAAGRYWRDATPNQQKALANEFRSLLLYSYSGALSQIKNNTVDVKPLRASDSDTEVEVRSQINQPRGEPTQLNYLLEKQPDGWKIYDLNIQGAWLVETYKGFFASEISKSGIDGLIKTLTERNKRLAEAWRK